MKAEQIRPRREEVRDCLDQVQQRKLMCLVEAQNQLKARGSGWLWD